MLWELGQLNEESWDNEMKSWDNVLELGKHESWDEVIDEIWDHVPIESWDNVDKIWDNVIAWL